MLLVALPPEQLLARRLKLFAKSHDTCPANNVSMACCNTKRLIVRYGHLDVEELYTEITESVFALSL